MPPLAANSATSASSASFFMPSTLTS
jgi:hypothetical protein